MKMKLSKSQQTVIQRMKKGDVCHLTQGMDAKCFFSDVIVSWATMWKLEQLGLVKRGYDKWELTGEGKL